MGPGQATINTILFIKQNMVIMLLFPATGGLLNAGMKLQELAVFRWRLLFEPGVMGAGITLLVLVGLIWIWNLSSINEID